MHTYGTQIKKILERNASVKAECSEDLKVSSHFNGEGLLKTYRSKQSIS